TPIYDFATLLSDYNKSSYGLVVTKGWNTWKLRQEALLEFIDYAKSQKVEFVNAIELIKKLRDIQAKEQIGAAYEYKDAEWAFHASQSNSTTNTTKFNGNITDAKVKISKDDFYCGYEAGENAGFFNGIDHIEVTYKSDVPLRLCLVPNDEDKPWQVLLNNTKVEMNSGKIPLSAFSYNPDDPGTKTSLDPKTVSAIFIQIANPNPTEDKEYTFSVKDIKLYGIATGISNTTAQVLKKNVTFKGIFNNTLKLNVTTSGKYTIDVFTANGRMISSMKNVQLKSGMNALNLNTVSKGAYLIKISTPDANVVYNTVSL
ncbi:MAG: T9SS type A sorting domain-containing protein, partial [Chitinivibrionales bacterium]|nr:T9SS type A sorting domain-containing protein [Chitinivibrionales bacterium]